jgi:hypothetical protein
VKAKKEELRKALHDALCPINEAEFDKTLDEIVSVSSTAQTPTSHVASPVTTTATTAVTTEGTLCSFVFHYSTFVPRSTLSLLILTQTDQAARVSESFGPPEIDPSEIQYNEQKDFLGAGSFGSVYSGICRGQRVAVKVPNKQKLSEQELEDFRNEVKLMK